MSQRSWITLLPALFALTACSSAQTSESATEQVGTAEQPILNGTADSGDTNVVDIIWAQSASSYAECSGSLLAPNMVLTAHHCVSEIVGAADDMVDCATASFSAPDNVENFYVSTSELLSMNLADYHHVRQIVVPPSSTGTKLCGVDQAILILEDNIASSEAVPLIPRVDSQIAAGEMYSAVGFGITMQGSTDAGTRRKLTALTVSCVGTSCTSIAGGQIEVTHEYIGDYGTCQGDSGGPALDQYNRVAGVTSRGGNDCTTPIYGDVYAWGSWINQTAQTAAQLGAYTVPTWATGAPTDPAYSAPVGAGCASDDSCPSYGTCVEGAYCSRLCNDAAPCPTGYTCEALSGAAGDAGADVAMVCQGVPSGFVAASSSGCAMARADPTKPVPWFFGVAGALVLAASSLAVSNESFSRRLPPVA